MDNNLQKDLIKDMNSGGLSIKLNTEIASLANSESGANNSQYLISTGQQSGMKFRYNSRETDNSNKGTGKINIGIINIDSQLGPLRMEN